MSRPFLRFIALRASLLAVQLIAGCASVEPAPTMNLPQGAMPPGYVSATFGKPLGSNPRAEPAAPAFSPLGSLWWARAEPRADEEVSDPALPEPQMSDMLAEGAAGLFRALFHRGTTSAPSEKRTVVVIQPAPQIHRTATREARRAQAKPAPKPKAEHRTTAHVQHTAHKSSSSSSSSSAKKPASSSSSKKKGK
jgi:hypothetical protein